MITTLCGKIRGWPNSGGKKQVGEAPLAGKSTPQPAGAGR